jgi:hypothetical protein
LAIQVSARQVRRRSHAASHLPVALSQISAQTDRPQEWACDRPHAGRHSGRRDRSCVIKTLSTTVAFLCRISTHEANVNSTKEHQGSRHFNAKLLRPDLKSAWGFPPVAVRRYRSRRRPHISLTWGRNRWFVSRGSLCVVRRKDHIRVAAGRRKPNDPAGRIPSSPDLEMGYG